MKKTLLTIIVASMIGACNLDKKQESETAKTDSTKVDSRAIVGADVDSHGCKASAGENWSSLKKACVQIFNVGSKFVNDGINKDETLAAFVILNAKGDSVEVFLPNQNTIIALATKSRKGVLFESKADSITICAEKAKINICKGNNMIFSQAKSTTEGLGKLLGLK